MSAIASAPQPSLEQPHTLLFFIATLVALAVAVLPPLWMRHDRRWRLPYWLAVLAAAAFVFMAAFPDWQLGLGMSAFGLVFMTVSAYFYTPFIKVRGKIYALHVRDSLADGDTPPGGTDAEHDPSPDSYAGLTDAKKYWWLILVAMAICVLNLVSYAGGQHKPVAAVLSALGLLVIANGLGYFDASWGYPVARGQRLQFGIAAAMTAGLFAIFYLSSYNAGKRWPLRRKESLEYRAHPCHQKNYPS
jgi:drug/metabolite transporter superfamily protein YnfA